MAQHNFKKAIWSIDILLVRVHVQYIIIAYIDDINTVQTLDYSLYLQHCALHIMTTSEIEVL